MKLFKITIFQIILITACTAFGQDKSVLKVEKKASFTIGETLTVHSNILNEDRLLNIYLPNGYSPDSLKKYPVIYLLDGSVDEDFIHIAGLVQFGSFPWIKMVPESIVVGIANIDRRRNYTFPTSIKKDKKDFPTTGKSEKFIAFVADELQPLIQHNYLVSNDKTIIGQSLGGLLATEILLKKPDLFDRYIIVSPSLWWDNESLLKFYFPKENSVKEIFVGVGKEGKVMENDAKTLFEKLKAEKNESTKIYFDFLAGQEHADALHLAVYHAFEKMFKAK
ncbi:MAG: alpha/beta hydrolase [Bacteroidetes bacterium]|nr:alpha/beta hydrolase [Bacteroidota bacterium]MBU1485898.1 alpha/beta hydrolase [Bacteroidota bacterium]MBU1762056.1 alpha/beta hydrolase [Bacteroidota bacterium]MBU2046828.1 alpha/beta hydrolase [Bacteroidota bacterium]MBU2269369.1 alpha/beta hydrolase [Bacteroidota bacterium]